MREQSTYNTRPNEEWHKDSIVAPSDYDVSSLHALAPYIPMAAGWQGLSTEEGIRGFLGMGFSKADILGHREIAQGLMKGLCENWPERFRAMEWMLSGLDLDESRRMDALVAGIFDEGGDVRVLNKPAREETEKRRSYDHPFFRPDQIVPGAPPKDEGERLFNEILKQVQQGEAESEEPFSH